MFQNNSTEFLFYRFENIYSVKTLFENVPKCNTSFSKKSHKKRYFFFLYKIREFEQNFSIPAFIPATIIVACSRDTTSIQMNSLVDLNRGINE